MEYVLRVTVFYRKMLTAICNTDRFSLPMTARTTKAALVVGVVYGGMQDLLGLARGRRISYIEYAKQRIGAFRADPIKF